MPRNHPIPKAINTTRRVSVMPIPALDSESGTTLQEHYDNLSTLIERAFDWKTDVKRSMYELHQYLSGLGFLRTKYAIIMRNRKDNKRITLSYDRVTFENNAIIPFLPRDVKTPPSTRIALMAMLRKRDNVIVRQMVSPHYRVPVRKPFYEYNS